MVLFVIYIGGDWRLFRIWCYDVGAKAERNPESPRAVATLILSSHRFDAFYF